MIIVMPVYCTLENERHQISQNSIASLLWSARPTQARILLVNNASTDTRIATFLNSIDQDRVSVVTMARNVYNVGAFNLGMSLCDRDEVFCTTEDDVLWKRHSWPDLLERLILGYSIYGAALCTNNFLTWIQREYDYDTKWVEGFGDIDIFHSWNIWNGSTAWHPLVREKIGYFHPPREGYGYTDVLYCKRVRESGIQPMVHIWEWPMAYLDHQRKDHPWRLFKRAAAKSGAQDWQKLMNAYEGGERSLYESIYPDNMEFQIIRDNARFWA
jgi:hypothetical protein